MDQALCIAATAYCAARMALVAKALAALGTRVTWVWTGEADDRAEAVHLGLPADTADGLPECDLENALVVIAHANDFTLAFAETAASAGAPILAVDAGARAFVDDRAARELDRRASFHLCATAHQRDNLRRDGISVQRALVIGCGLAATAQRLAGSARSDTVALWLLGEHDRQALRAAAEAVAEEVSLAVVHCSSLRELSGARAVVTDSDAAAVFACALGIPCVTVAWHTSR
ncbi:MAG: hypothetical protein ABL997_18965, partial [Planctomycetota bacterium]